MAVGYTSGDPRKVDVAGDTMTGELVLVNSNPATGLTAVSKTYADAEAAEAQNAALVSASGSFVPQAQIPTENLFNSDPFYIAHRGSGAVYPEHTLAAYDAAVGMGAQAIEVSCQISADGVLYCLHDTTLDRMTENAVTGSNVTWTWSELRQRAQVVTTQLLGPGWTAQQMPTVAEVLERYLGKVIIFLEPKSNPAVTPLQAMLNKFRGANKSVVWKQHYTGTGFAWAKTNGYTTWAYIDEDTSMAAMDAVQANVDMWGVPISASDAKFTEVLSRTPFKRVISWPIWRRSERDRLIGFNVNGNHVQGIMSSELAYLTRTTPIRNTDAFGRAVKQPGQLPGVKEDKDFTLKFNQANSSAYLPALSGSACHFGDLSNNTSVGASGGHRISFDMMYPNVPGAAIHAGLIFGLTNDSRHQFNSTSNTISGYRFLLRGNGDMQTYTFTAGVAAGTQLDTFNIGALNAGEWLSFQIDVLPTQLIVRCTTRGVTRTVVNTEHRGLYFGIHNGSLTVANTIPEFRNVSDLPV